MIQERIKLNAKRISDNEAARNRLQAIRAMFDREIVNNPNRPPVISISVGEVNGAIPISSPAAIEDLIALISSELTSAETALDADSAQAADELVNVAPTGGLNA